MASMSETLRTLRLSAGYSQGEMAKMLGVAPSTISMYENGNRSPYYDVLKKYSEIFNVDYNYLHGDDGIVKVEQKSVFAPSNDVDITEEKKLLLDLFDQVPEEQQQMVLNMIKVALGKDK